MEIDMPDFMIRAEHTEAQEKIFQKMVKWFDDKRKEDRAETEQKEEEARKQMDKVLEQLAELNTFFQEHRAHAKKANDEKTEAIENSAKYWASKDYIRYVFYSFAAHRGGIYPNNLALFGHLKTE